MPSPEPRAAETPAPPRRGPRLGLLVFVAALLAAVVAVWVARPWDRPAKAGAGASPTASAAAGPAPPMVVEGTALTSRPLRVTAAAVGSLVANESVDLAAELPRRLVRVLAVDGARVKKGELLFQLDDADLAAQSRELSVRRKLLADAELRQKKLVAEGLSSVAEYERVQADLELVKAQLGSLAVTISRTQVRAPFAGRLGLRTVSVGTLLTPSTTLVTLQDDTRVKVDFLLPERYAAYVAAGQTFTFRIAGSDKPYEATVSAIEPAIEAGSRSLRVRGVTDNPGGELMVGGFVTVEFPLASEDGGLLVPSIAVIPSLGGHGVWVAREGKAHLVDVELGVRTDTEVQVTKGLAAGDVVITTNLLRLRPGAAVKVAGVGG